MCSDVEVMSSGAPAGRHRASCYSSVVMDRMVWTPADVVDVDGPRSMMRAYLEQRDVRTLLAHASGGLRLGAACDVGCGFGRLTPVLTEVASDVVGFEREADLLAAARALQPSVEFRAIDTLSRLPAASGSFDVGLVFTVLQHVPEPDVLAVVDELRRIVKPSGHLLLCEETNETLEAGDRRQAHLGYTCGRPVATYQSWMSPWSLVTTRVREIEPGYPRADVGTYMLFAGPAATRA
jgi:SAM-dependent methyltransferase